MKELTFKEKFPEMAGKEKQLEEELLEMIGPDISSDPHVTREYRTDDFVRDQVNAHKRALRSRLSTYLHNQQPTLYSDKK
jgi:hypothetical protein